MDERIDYGLLLECAKRRPDWSFVLLGPLLKVKPEKLFGRPNVHYLGAKPYAELAQYMKAFDVAIMPFVLSELTSKINPTKTLEYLSAALPVVSSRVPDVVSEFSDLVWLYDDPDSFIRSVEECLVLPGEKRTSFQQAAKGHSWEEMVSGMLRLVEAGFAERSGS